MGMTKRAAMEATELRAILARFDLTTDQFGAICAITGLAVRRYQTDPAKSGHRAIPGPVARIARIMDSGEWPEKKWRKLLPKT